MRLSKSRPNLFEYSERHHLRQNQKNLEVSRFTPLIMEQIFFLLTTLIEYGDCTSDGHSLYWKKEKAIEAFKDEIRDCAEHFDGQKGDFIIDLSMCKEWRNEDDNGYT